MSVIFPEIKTKRLILKAVTEADIPAYQKHFAHWEIVRYLTKSVPWPYPDDGAEQYLKNCILPKQGSNLWMWGIFLPDNIDELIGIVHICKKDKVGHRGFWLAKEHHGQGYMTEAVIPVIDFAFKELDIEKFIFENAVVNRKSARIKEKTGATLIEVKPAEFIDPDVKEEEIWELTASDWKKNRQNLNY